MFGYRIPGLCGGGVENFCDLCEAFGEKKTDCGQAVLPGRKMDLGAHAVFGIFNGAYGMMAFQNHTHQIKAQAAAAGGAAPGRILPVEGLKEMRKGIVSDMRAGIFNPENRTSLFHAAPYADFGGFRRIVGGIGEEISDGFTKEGRVSGYKKSRRKQGL